MNRRVSDTRRSTRITIAHLSSFARSRPRRSYDESSFQCFSTSIRCRTDCPCVTCIGIGEMTETYSPAFRSLLAKDGAMSPSLQWQRYARPTDWPTDRTTSAVTDGVASSRRKNFLNLITALSLKHVDQFSKRVLKMKLMRFQSVAQMSKIK